MDNIKQRLRTKPPRPRRAHSLIRLPSILLMDLDRLASPAASCSIGHQLRVTALLHADEPEHGLLNGLADG